MSDKQTVKFGDICREVKLTTKDPIADGYERYIGLEHLDSGSLKIKRWGLIAEDNPSFNRVFKKGHILFGKRRPYLKKAAIAEFDGICSGDIIVLKPITPEQFELLELAVQMKGFWDWAVQTSSGSLSPRTKFSAMKEYIFPLTLDELDSVGKLVKPINFTASKMNELTASIHKLRNAFLEKEFWSFYYRKSYVPLESLCKKITDGTHQKVERDTKGKVPFLYVSCISSGEVVWDNTDRISLKTYSEISRGREIDENVVLYAAVGSYGNAVHLGFVTEAAFQRHIAYIKVDPIKANPKFIEIWMNSRFGKFHSDRLAIGNAQKTVTLGDLAKFPVPNLSIEEQDKIVYIYRTIGSVISETSNRISSYSAIKSSLVEGR